jgi:hypothetical protein
MAAVEGIFNFMFILIAIVKIFFSISGRLPDSLFFRLCRHTPHGSKGLCQYD